MVGCGDVVIVSLSRDLGKLRPAVVVKAEPRGDTTLVCPITTNVQSDNPYRLELDPHPLNGLVKKCSISAEGLTNVKISRIKHKIGYISLTDRVALDQILKRLLGFS